MILPGRCTRPRTDIAVTLLPQPDSPTMPSVSPGYSSKLTSRTALTSPSSVKKDVLRFLTSSTGRVIPVPPSAGYRASALLSGIECVPKAVSEEVERQQRNRQGYRRKQCDVRDEPNCRKALAGHPSPVGLRRWQPQAEESEKRLGEDGDGNDERALDDDRAQGVGKDVTEQHLARAGTARPRCFNEFAFTNAERLAAHEPGHIHPDGHGDGDHDGEQAGAEKEIENKRDQQRRDAVEDVDHETDHAVYLAAKA